ncbi:MAG: PEP-CTERM sorting domain-containing protein [Spirulinaceae cyanobacterium]
MFQKLSIATVGAAAIALGTCILGAKTATAADIKFNVEAEILGNAFISPLLANFSDTIPTGNIPIANSFSHSLTINDDPNQYLDGDISLGLNLLFSTFDISIDDTTISNLDSLFDFSVSGSGVLSNGSEDLDFDLSYDSNNNEILATFVNFDPNNNFIDSCLVASCTTTGNFAFSILSNFLPTPLSVVSAAGSFSLVSTPILDDTGVPDDSTQSVPEPTTILALLGVGSFLAYRRKQGLA